MTTLYDAKNNKIGIIDYFNVLNDQILEVVLLNGRTMRFGRGDVIRDNPYSWHIRYGGYNGVPYNVSRQSTERAEKNDIVKFGMCSVSIRKVIFNDPATVVLWSDGTKTVVKCGPEDKFDTEKGLAMAIVKKMAGNDNSFHKVFKQYPKKKKKEPGSIGSIPDMMSGLKQAAAITANAVHELAHMAAAKAERGE